eukprot:4445922-Pleurochrysis_carterae.AAC.1
MKLRTGDMMNWARIQMKNWMDKKNEHRAFVQKRWDNRGITKEVFQKWKAITRSGKAITRPDSSDNDKGTEHEKDKGINEKTYGIKHWGRVRTVPKLHKQVKRFLQAGVG